MKELIEEAGLFVGIEKGETLHLYDYQGSEITNENDIRDGMLYVVAGEEDFDMRFCQWMIFPLITVLYKYS